MAGLCRLYTTRSWRSALLLLVLSCSYARLLASSNTPYNIGLPINTSIAAPPRQDPPSPPSTIDPDTPFTSLASSSSGGRVDTSAPVLSRVSGCVDDDTRTGECPDRLYIDLTLYGRNFQRSPISVAVTGSDVEVPCGPVRVSTDEQLRCAVDFASLPRERRQVLSARLDSPLGASTLVDAISVADELTQPQVTAVTGCIDTDDGHTRDCTLGAEVNVAGSHFPLWLPPLLIVDGWIELPCHWMAPSLNTVRCPLHNHRVTELPTGRPLPVQLVFSDERRSPPVDALSMRSEQPRPPPSQPSRVSSSSTGRVEELERDYLEPVSVLLFAVCVVALAAIVAGALVWAAGLWKAYRRAYVSAYGRAATTLHHELLP